MGCCIGSSVGSYLHRFQETGIIADLLKRSAKEKVARMQQLIGFDNDKANQLCKLELHFCWRYGKLKPALSATGKKGRETENKARGRPAEDLVSR